MKDTGERLIPEGHTRTLTYGEHLSRYLSVLDVTKGKIVLDIASGAGYGTKLIAETAKKVYGVDYDKEAVKYAQEHYGSDNIVYKVGDAHKIPLVDSSVDVVVSLETIEHLKDPAKFVAEVKRLLRPGGQFIVSTPNDNEFIEGNEFHIHEFDLSELEALIKKNFKTAEFYYQGTYFSAGLLSRNVFEKGGNWQGSTVNTFGQPRHKAIYFLAIASDKAAGKLQENLIAADSWSTKDNLERSGVIQTNINNLESSQNSLQERVNQYEQEIEIHKQKSHGLLEENRNLKSEADRLNTTLEAIYSSKGWRLLNKFYYFHEQIKTRK